MFTNLSTPLLRALKAHSAQLYSHTLKTTTQNTLYKNLHFPIALNYSVISNSQTPSQSSLKKVTVPPLAIYSECVSAGLKYMSEQDTKAAHRLFQKALKLSVDLFGEKSKNAVVCLNYLAQNSHLGGNMKHSLKFYNEALSIASDSSQLNYLMTSDIHHDINIVYQRQGNLPRARHHAEVSLKLLNEYFPEEYKRQSLVLQSLGHISTLLNNLGEAKEFLFESFDLLVQNGEENTPEFRLLCDKIANLLEKEGNNLEAIKYRKEALRITDDHLVTKESLFNQYLNLAALYSKLNKDEESVKCLEKAYEHLDKDDQSQNDIHRGPLLMKIGHLYLKTGKKTNAIYNLQEGLKYLSKDPVHGQKMIEKAERMLSQAKLLKSDDELKLERLKESLNVMMESSVSYSLEDAEGYRELGYSCRKEFDEVNAQKAFIRALQIFGNIKGPDCEECDELKQQLKDYDFN